MKLGLILLYLLSFNLFAQVNEKYVKLTAETFKNDYIAITLEHTDKWHTYWKNPGDAGLPIEFIFSINGRKTKLIPQTWPTPKRYFDQGDMLSYGYGNTDSFFFKVSAEDKVLLETHPLEIHGKWLVCKDICIPGEAKKTLKLRNFKGKVGSLSTTPEMLNKAFNMLPKKGRIEGLEVYLSKSINDNQLVLHYTLANAAQSAVSKNGNLLTPYPTDPVTFKKEELYYDQKNKTFYGRMLVDWDGEYAEPEWPLPSDGVFRKPLKSQVLIQLENKKPVIVDLNLPQYSMTGDKSYLSFLKTLTPAHQQTKTISPVPSGSILTFILFAFLGGLILNLMPCVLPVISLKLFGLIVHSGESKKNILKHNLAYTAGVISTFLLLGLIFLLIKQGGEEIGWGFQLQSPTFVFIMLIMIFIMGLNMLGLFEFVTPGGKTLGNTELKKGFSGDFLNGVLATILSTPCSAPLLGPALSFAITESGFTIFLIFFFVGLGLASPFILTGIFPKLISFLPKPGAWMEKLKNILGFSMLLTFVWLYDVFANLIDFSFFGIYINVIIVLIFISFFVRNKITKRFGWNLFVFVLPIALTIHVAGLGGFKTSEISSSTSRKTSSLNWNKWSTEAMQSHIDKKEYVFMDFTAKWCLTCKVNKKLVLETESFEKLVKQHDLKLLIGDWTKRDDNITKFLKSYNIVGVPAYFIQKPDGTIISLGETISVGKIKKNLK